MHLTWLVTVPVTAALAVFVANQPQSGTGAGGGAATTAPAARPSASAAPTYAVDGVHSSALFRVQHLGAGQFWGRFNDVSGTFTGNSASPEGVSFDITVKVDSVDTRTKKLDDHLRSADFFNVVEHPTMTFKSTGAKAGSDGKLSVTGNFTLLGVTKSVTAAVEFTGAKAGAMGDRAGYEAILTIKRSEFGMKYGVDNGMLGDDVRIVVNLEGVKK
jgi:polyisoprenoid-binding protein YceI